MTYNKCKCFLADKSHHLRSIYIYTNSHESLVAIYTTTPTKSLVAIYTTILSSFISTIYSLFIATVVNLHLLVSNLIANLKEKYKKTKRNNTSANGS